MPSAAEGKVDDRKGSDPVNQWATDRAALVSSSRSPAVGRLRWASSSPRSLRASGVIRMESGKTGVDLAVTGVERLGESTGVRADSSIF